MKKVKSQYSTCVVCTRQKAASEKISPKVVYLRGKPATYQYTCYECRYCENTYTTDAQADMNREAEFRAYAYLVGYFSL